ncbi:hypothetical protein AMATHDRAFT_54261 [Amanita thiersii Skay4041]|uniref:F-box domain-containing protein n=1 Tax=Amanita thiersii Skay4041 TaxID=703135 RepID=A0A2A9NWG9_9AGAR|nr:hypothetical protein AMATHDRAFT_54261 [Amanita thiersii Skay4041]
MSPPPSFSSSSPSPSPSPTCSPITFNTSPLLFLNTELLINLLDNCLSLDLLAVSHTCRRLHYVALPLYLSRFAIPSLHVTSLHLEGRYMHALMGLQSSLVLPPLDHLSVKFNDGPYFATEVRRLLTFVLRLGRIREVTLNLASIDSRWVNGLVSINSETWCSDLLQLLSILVENKCEKLTVTQGYFLTYESHVAVVQQQQQQSPPPPLPMVLHDNSSSSSTNVPPPATSPATTQRRRSFLQDSLTAVSNFFVRPSLVVSGMEMNTEQRPGPVELQAHTLRTFRLHSNLFFTHPFYSWMTNMLQTTPITSLSLQLSGVMQEEWTALLEFLSLPTLTHVAFASSCIHLNDILRFVARHPSITNVDLHRHYQYSCERRLSKKLRVYLPELSSLGGTPENVRLFLTRSHHIPSLQHIALSLPVHQRTFRPNDFESLNRVIACSIKGTQLHTLSLEFLVPVFCDQLPNCNNKRVYDGSEPPTLSYGSLIQAVASSPQQYARSSFASLETLKFSADGNFAFAKWVLPALPRWLAMFPALRRVTLATNCLPSHVQSKEDVVRSIKAACRLVTDVVLDDNDNVRKSSYWLD